MDPGGWSGVRNVVVPLLGRRLRYDAVESLRRAREQTMTHGAEITDGDWKEHVNLISKAVYHQRSWVASKAREIGYDGFCQVVIMEGFALGSETYAGDVLSPVRISAVLEWLLADYVEEFRRPLPAEKAQITDDRLKLWGWFTPGKGHLNDATRHLFNYLRSIE